jgi:hypothetical protein
LEKVLMIARRFAAASLLVAFGMTLGVCGSARGANLPPNVRQAISIQPVIPTIQQYIEKNIASLTGDDSVAQSKAREDLASEVMTPPGQNPPTAQFLKAYATELNRLLLPLAKHDDPRVRLNAAIVAERVAKQADNDALLPTVAALLNDSNDGTRMWALKAAKFLLPAAVSAPGNPGQGLVASIVKVGSESESGAVVQTVYEALATDKGKLADAAWAKVLASVFPALHEILRVRIGRYAEGVPDEPLADSKATTFLTERSVWPTQTPAQQVQTIQLISDLVAVAAQRSDGATSDQRQDIIWLLRRGGKAMQVAGEVVKNAQLASAGAGLAKILTTATPDDIVNAAKAVYPALKSVEGFKDLKPPPSVGSAADKPPATTNAR